VLIYSFAEYTVDLPQYLNVFHRDKTCAHLGGKLWLVINFFDKHLTFIISICLDGTRINKNLQTRLIYDLYLPEQCLGQ